MTRNSKSIPGLAFAAIGLASVALAGCASPQLQPGDPGITATPETASLTKPITVTRVESVGSVTFADGSDRLTAGDVQTINAFIADQGVRFNDVIAVELPPQGSRADSLASRRFAAIGVLLEDRGYKVVGRRVSDSAPGTVRFFYDRHVASVERCEEQWRRPAWLNYENLPLQHLGCATSRNLATMVDDPKDLAVGRQPGGTDAELAALAIQRYRQSKTPELKKE